MQMIVGNLRIGEEYDDVFTVSEALEVLSKDPDLLSTSLKLRVCQTDTNFCLQRTQRYDWVGPALSYLM